MLCAGHGRLGNTRDGLYALMLETVRQCPPVSPREVHVSRVFLGDQKTFAHAIVWAKCGPSVLTCDATAGFQQVRI